MANTPLRYKTKTEVATGTWSFVFEKPADFFFEAGQYVALVLPRLVVPDARGPVRSLSMCSAPCEADLVFTVRASESGYKQTLLALMPGEVVQATKPVGTFTLSHASDDQPIVFLAGGIGVTPVRSLLIQAVHDRVNREFTFFYANRQAKYSAFHDELKALTLPQYQFVSTLEGGALGPNEEHGYITADMIKKYVPADTLQSSWYYVVGTPSFVSAMEKELAVIGFDKKRFVCDPFTGMEHTHQVKTV